MFRVIDIPWWYYLISLVIATVMWKCWRWEGGLLAGYVFLILAYTLLTRQSFVGKHLQLVFLWSWKEWKAQRNQIITNILMFIPVGIFAEKLWKWRGIVIGIGLSCMIEALQYLTARGLCEYDDVLHNSLGALIGVVIVMLIRLITGKKKVNGNQRT